VNVLELRVTKEVDCYKENCETLGVTRAKLMCTEDVRLWKKVGNESPYWRHSGTVSRTYLKLGRTNSLFDKDMLVNLDNHLYVNADNVYSVGGYILKKVTEQYAPFTFQCRLVMMNADLDLATETGHVKQIVNSVRDLSMAFAELRREASLRNKYLGVVCRRSLAEEERRGGNVFPRILVFINVNKTKVRDALTREMDKNSGSYKRAGIYFVVIGRELNHGLKTAEWLKVDDRIANRSAYLDYKENGNLINECEDWKCEVMCEIGSYVKMY